MKHHLLILLLLLPRWVGAATHTAASVAYADVATARNLCVAGDILQIPAGVATWTTNLPVSIGIEVTGAGIGQTVIVDESSRAMQFPQMFIFNCSSGYPQIDNITIAGGSQSKGENFDGEILFTGGTKTFRVHDMNFLTNRSSSIEVNGCVGVIDHNQFNSRGMTGIICFWSSFPTVPGSFGNGSWVAVDELGTSNMVYIESNFFTNNNFEGVLDAYKGARFVFRYNTIQDSFVATHGTDTGQQLRGVRLYEIYGNVFNWNPANPSNTPWPFGIYLRGGTGVIFSNSFSGAGSYQNQTITMATYRATTNPEGWPNWTPWGPVWNTGGTSPANAWDGNTQTTGYPCLDSVGMGAGDVITNNNLNQPFNSTAGGIVQWPHQQVDPMYQWSNSYVGGSITIGSQTADIVVNRNWYNNIQRPGYTPFVFPHPLVSGGPAPPPPPNSLARVTNLHVNNTHVGP